uniref:Dirigent protein n=1 Tax=Oryza nivara TaxID=4536 RepID=A0A0E0J6M7_ORYNI
MAYPPSSGYPITGSSLQVTPCGALVEQYNELNFRNLYLHHLYLGPNRTQSVMLAADAATGLGATTVNNWPIYDGLGSLVARARGLHVYAGDWHNSFTIVFEDQSKAIPLRLDHGVELEALLTTSLLHPNV